MHKILRGCKYRTCFHLLQALITNEYIISAPHVVYGTSRQTESTADRQRAFLNTLNKLRRDYDYDYDFLPLFQLGYLLL